MTHATIIPPGPEDQTTCLAVQPSPPSWRPPDTAPPRSAILLAAGSRVTYGGVEPSFELFDHTADMGIRVRAATMPELLKPAVDGLYSAVGELVPIGPAEPYSIELSAEDAAYLLRDFLAEVLSLFEHRSRMATDLKSTTFDERHLAVTIRTRGVDGERSVFNREVKAITYHELSVRAIAGGFEATLIVDI